MARELSIPLSIGPASLGAQTVPRSFASLAVPLLGSLFQTYGAVWVMCRTPWPSSLTWTRLFFTATFFLLVTFVAHLFAVWFNRRIFRDHVDAPLKLLAFVIWPSVVWLPLLVLFVRERSVWAAFVLPVITASAFFSLKRWFVPGRPAATAPVEEGTVFTIFHPQRPQPFVRRLAPALATSIAFQGAVAEIALGRPIFAGSLFAACTLVPIWITPTGLQPFRSDQPAGASVRAVAPRTLAVLILLAIALIPYLRSPILAQAFQDLLGATLAAAHHPASARSHSVGHASGYSGIVLTLPPRPQPKALLLTPPSLLPVPSVRRKPTVIPFDGQYWYFKRPDDRPDANSPIVRGDPLKRNIASTDDRVLSMEAHQRLPDPVLLNCCRSLRLTLENAETALGPISVEILLKNTAVNGSVSRSLGSQVIPSSGHPRLAGAHPAGETLTFPFPPHARAGQFNEITVALRPAPGQARKAPHVAVESFELVP